MSSANRLPSKDLIIFTIVIEFKLQAHLGEIEKEQIKFII